MPLKLKNAAMMPARTAETVEAVGITIPVYPHYLAAEKLTFASLGGSVTDPAFVLQAFCVFTKWRCPAEDHVEFDDLNRANLEGDEISAIAAAVGRLFAATRENDSEKSEEGKAKTTTQS